MGPKLSSLTEDAGKEKVVSWVASAEAVDIRAGVVAFVLQCLVPVRNPTGIAPSWAKSVPTRLYSNSVWIFWPQCYHRWHPIVFAFEGWQHWRILSPELRTVYRQCARALLASIQWHCVQ